jgi:hypothetical protein
MGFAARSCSLIRYRVKGEPEGAFWDAVHEGIRRGAFRESDAPGDLVGFGWTSLEDFSQFRFDDTSYVRGSYVAMALRIDIVRVPPKVLEIQVKKEAQQLLEMTGAKRLSSGQYKDLKERVRDGLRKRVLPSIQVFDLIWDTGSGTVYFGNLGLKARERVEEHFKKCFGLTLIPLIPYLRAEELIPDAAVRDRLEKLRASSFVP